MILVSACLLGRKCTYKGSDNYNEAVVRALKDKDFCPVCPEEAGGLDIPRPPAEIQGAGGAAVLEGEARVKNNAGQDVTENFLTGARKTLETAATIGATLAILKDGSPSCGVHRIYDGSFEHHKVPGQGVTAALLAREGFLLISEDDIQKLP